MRGSESPEVVAGGSSCGDRFVARLGSPSGPGWFAAEELWGPALPAILAAVGAARGTADPAVSATLLFEQYAQRLVAPALAVLLRDGAVLCGQLPLVRAQVVDGTLCRLSFARVPEPAVDGAAGRDRMLAALAAGNLEPVAEIVHRHTRIGMRVLRGAVANAIATSLLQMSWADEDRSRHLADARTLLAGLPGAAELVNVRVEVVAGRPWMYADRNTCCQAFRTGINRARALRYCSNCPIVPRATTAELFVRATAAYEAQNAGRAH